MRVFKRFQGRTLYEYIRSTQKRPKSRQISPDAQKNETLGLLSLSPFVRAPFGHQPI